MPPLKSLLHTEMTRKQFLVTLGAALIAVLGFNSIVRLFTGRDTTRHLAGSHSPAPYGNSKK